MIRAIIFDCFGVLYTAMVNEELLNYAKNLKAEYKIGLLSNTGEDIVQSIFDADTIDMFDVAVLSYEELIAKPDPRIFKITAERLELLPEECIMVDDTESNCDAAGQAGMVAVLHISNDDTIATINKLIGA